MRHAPVSIVSPYVRHKWREWNYEIYAKEGYGGNPYIFRGINFLTNFLGSINFVVEDIGGDKPAPIENHPLIKLLDRPNKWMGKSLFMQTIGGHLLIGGRSHIIKVGPQTNMRSEDRTIRAPRELHLVGPDVMDFVRSKNVADPYYPIARFEYRPQGTAIPYAPEDVVYMRMFHPTDPLDGLPPLMACSRCVDLNNEGRLWNMSLLKNGARPSGVFTVDGTLDPIAFERGKQQLRDELGGPTNAGNVLLLEGGASWQELSYSPDRMAWETLNRVTGREIAITLNVPPELCGDSEQKTYSNYKTAVKAGITEGGLPLLDMIVDELNVQLVPDFCNDPLNPNIRLNYIKDDIEGLSEDRDAVWKRTTDAHFLSINQKLEATGYESIGPAGDVILVPANLIPLDDITNEGAGAQE